MGHRRKPVLQISFGAMLSIGQGALHRLFLLTTCPSKLYSKYNQGIDKGNEVIDRLLTEVAKSLRTAYWAGVETPAATFYIVCLGLAGDHIFQTKAFRCTRHHTRNSICPHCLANVSSLPFEDIDVANALWVQTALKSKPWQRDPPLAVVPGAARPEFIRFDLMHVLPHGCGRNFVSSVIAMMCGPLRMFAGSSKVARLEEAYSFFASFCESRHLFPRDMQEFTPENLGWKLNRDFPDMSCKASDCNMLVQWVIDYLSSTPVFMGPPLEWAYKACVGFDDFCRLCYSSTDRVFWSRAEAHQGMHSLRVFLKGYKALAA